jgi:hypothetical protein
MDEPWDLFFGDFAISAIFTGANGDVTIPVLFEENFDPTFMRSMFDYQSERTGMTAQSRMIALYAQTALLPLLKAGDQVRTNGKTYTLQPGWYPVQDGKVTRLELSETYGY